MKYVLKYIGLNLTKMINLWVWFTLQQLSPTPTLSPTPHIEPYPHIEPHPHII